MRAVFLGTSEFAVPALRAIAAHHGVLLVVTQPDRPAGRHAILAPPPVKRTAEELGLDVFQPDRVSQDDAVARLRAEHPDVLVVAAYGQLLRAAVFELAPLGAINIHASLLPRYRGAAPVSWAITRGETMTGVTTFIIDRGMDTGPMLLSRSLAIEPAETAGDLEPRLAALGAQLVLETLAGLEERALSPTPQPDGATLAPKLKRGDGRIDWTRTARDVHNLVRGMNPWPGAWALLSSGRVKIHRTALTGISVGPLPPGSTGPRESDRLLVACGDELLEILEVQRDGRARAAGSEFRNGLSRNATFS